MSKTPRVDELTALWDDDGASRGSAYIELRNLAWELEKQNAELLAALKEIADIKLADLPLDTAGVMEPHRMQGIAWRAIDKALGVAQPSTQEVSNE